VNTVPGLQNRVSKFMQKKFYEIGSWKNINFGVNLLRNFIKLDHFRIKDKKDYNYETT